MIGAVAATLAALLRAPAEGLELRLRPVKDAYRKGEPVAIEELCRIGDVPRQARGPGRRLASRPQAA
jgi:gas vesicle protein